MAGSKGICRYCKGEILWAINHKGGGAPLDPVPIADGRIVIEGYADDGRPQIRYLQEGEAAEAKTPRYQVHFDVCPEDEKRQAAAAAKAQA